MCEVTFVQQFLARDLLQLFLSYYIVGGVTYMSVVKIVILDTVWTVYTFACVDSCERKALFRVAGSSLCLLLASSNSSTSAFDSLCLRFLTAALAHKY